MEENQEGMTAEQKDEVFTDEERVGQILKLSSDSYTRETKKIDVKTIGFLTPIQKGRKDTLRGLTQTIEDLGVVTPIHVMTVPDETKSDDYQYVLLDGLRRVFGALKNGITEIEAVVWDFKDKRKAMDIALVLSLLFNRVQRHSYSEIWRLYQVLEAQDNFTPGTLEYLLQLRGGDAMKIKDIMLCEFEEVRETFLTEKKDIDGCYRLLQKYRKELDMIGHDDATGTEQISEDVDSIANEDNKTGKKQLSDDDVKELLDMADDLDSLDDVTSDDFADMNKVDKDFIEKQKVGERHPLDPTLRNAVLARDNFTCQCCGMRMVGARLGLIAVHHKLPVHVGGQDTIPNLVTLCLNCHISLHIMERNGGSIMMSEEDYNKLPESEKESLRRALKLAKVALEADKRRGLSKEQVAEATKPSLRHPMPGEGMKGNEEAYALARKNGSES